MLPYCKREMSFPKLYKAPSTNTHRYNVIIYISDHNKYSVLHLAINKIMNIFKSTLGT